MVGGITFLRLLEGEWYGPHMELSAKCYPYLRQSGQQQDKVANISFHLLVSLRRSLEEN